MRLAVADDRCVDAAAAQLREILDRVDGVASRFRPDSELSRVNARSGTPVALSRDLLRLVDAAMLAAASSSGAVDPTVGADLLAWGYDRDIADLLPDGPAPHLVSRRSSWKDVRLDREAGILIAPRGVQLDLGASAKAATADFAARQLHERFGTPVMVELGGDLSVEGSPDGGWPIWVAERDGGPGELITLHHGGLATSTTEVRRWTRGGHSAHHIIDPRTGAPTDGCWRTVTVAAPTALAANTASTAAIVLGDAAERWLRGQGLAARLVHRNGDLVLIGGWPIIEQEPAGIAAA